MISYGIDMLIEYYSTDKVNYKAYVLSIVIGDSNMRPKVSKILLFFEHVREI
jgi:hypothetical protein